MTKVALRGLIVAGAVAAGWFVRGPAQENPPTDALPALPTHQRQLDDPRDSIRAAPGDLPPFTWRT
jgi:hypothetical protein